MSKNSCSLRSMLKNAHLEWNITTSTLSSAFWSNDSALFAAASKLTSNVFLDKMWTFMSKGFLFKDDTSKPEQRFKAWAKNLCTRQALSKPWDMKILQVFFNIRGKILVFSKKCWIPWVSCFYFAFQEISSKKIFFSIFFLTDRKKFIIKSCSFSNT